MRKIILIALLIPLKGLSQDTEVFKRNDIMLNAGYLIAGFPEISYEHLINDESGAGISVGFSVDKNIDYKFEATPHYRFYFAKKPASGFFLSFAFR